MHIVTFALVFVAPQLAFACMNSMVVRFDTYPLDFALWGMFAASLVLLLWRGQPVGWSRWDDPDAVIGPDPHLPEGERSESDAPRYDGPSLAREFAYLAGFALAGIGIGLFQAKELALGLSPPGRVLLVTVPLVSIALVASHRERFGDLWVALRRVILVGVALTSFAKAFDVQAGYTEHSVSSFHSHDQLNSVVTF